VNNCVGQNNQKHFILFLCYTLTISTYALMMLAMRAVSTVSAMEHLSQRNRPGALMRPLAGPNGYSSHSGTDDAGPVFVNCLLFFESILFGLFTCAMLTDQLTSVLNDTTAIERLKKEEHARSEPDTCLYALSETFGRPCSLTWLLPTSVKFNGLTYEQLSSTELYSMPYEQVDGSAAHMRRERSDSRSVDLSDTESDETLAPRYAHAHSSDRAPESENLAARSRHGTGVDHDEL